MNKLFELGISESDIKNMIELVPEIYNMDEEDINNKIDILKYVECSDRHIRNIIVSNPMYLDRTDDGVLRLISYLKKVGFSNINLLFDSNPYFLNYDVFELEDYINKQVNLGKSIDVVVDEIEDNPYVIEE